MICCTSVCQPKTMTTYTFGVDCSVSLEYIDENDVIYAQYDGGKLSTWCDDMSFIGRGDEIMDEYELCVTPEYYEDPDCAVEVVYHETYGGKTIQTFTCYNKPASRYCGEAEEFLYITVKSLSSDKQNVRFKLKVEAVKVYDYNKTVGIIVGSVFGGLAVLSIIVGLVICAACRRKRSQGQVFNPVAGGAAPLMQQNQPVSGYPTQQSGGYPTQQSGGYPIQQSGGYPIQPVGNYPMHPATGVNQTQATAPPVDNMNVPPPSYSTAMASS